MCVVSGFTISTVASLLVTGKIRHPHRTPVPALGCKILVFVILIRTVSRFINMIRQGHFTGDAVLIGITDMFVLQTNYAQSMLSKGSSIEGL